MVILMFSFTFLMEIFFGIFLPSAKFDQYYMIRAVILLFLLPIILIFLSYCFEEGTRFFLDAIDRREGSLRNFRLALAVVIHYLCQKNNHQQMETSINDSSTSTTSIACNDEGTLTAFSSERKRTSKLFLTSMEDPFNDDDDDIEIIDLSSIRDSRKTPMPTNPRLRWKKAIALIRAVLMIRRIQANVPEIDYSTHVIVDFICPVLFEIVTCMVFTLTVLTTWSLYEGFLAYIRCGFYFLGSYLLIWMVIHFLE
jgi:lipase ATG15